MSISKANYLAYVQGYRSASARQPSILPGIKIYAPWVVGLAAFWAIVITIAVSAIS